MGDGAVIKDSPFPLTDVDKWVLSQTDEEFKYHSWDELRGIIERNELEVLKRKPSDLRRYMDWSTKTKAEYGSVTKYIQVHRLPQTWGEPPFTPVSSTPFEDPSDYRVLINDWPYGLADGITHIVVWLRTAIQTDPTTGDMTPESKRTVEAFIKRFFVDTLGPGGDSQVLYFKNWVALQSVRTLEHIHVMVNNVSPAILEKWTEELECHKKP